MQSRSTAGPAWLHEIKQGDPPGSRRAARHDQVPGGVSLQSLKVRWPSAHQRTFLAVQKIAVFTLGSVVRMRAVGCNQHHSGNQLPFLVVLVYETTKRSGVAQEHRVIEHAK